MAAAPIACVPIKLDCLVMNDKVGENESVKVAPIAQPNYTFLRLNNQTIQNDVLPFTDLHYTSPVERNQRLTDLGTGNRRTNREGVYVSWTLPRAYRMGAAGTKTASSEARRAKEGYQPIDKQGTPDFSAPDFRPVPTRWLIVRYLDLAKLVTPTTISADEKAKLQFQAWVLDSDRYSQLENIPLQTKDGRDVDLQTDYSPFVKAQRENSQTDIEYQAEVFVGFKTVVDEWSEDLSRPSVPMSLLNSSNHLFADYQPHNSNVFSMIDEMTCTDTSGNLQKITSATVSYYVIGWHPKTADNLFYIDSSVKNTSRNDRMGDLAMVMKDASIGGADCWQKDETSSDILCHGAMYNVQWSNIALVPDNTAQAAADLIAEKSPIAIGRTAVDALITLIKAHVDDDSGDLKRLEQDLIAIQTLILAQDDGVDANMQANDLLESYSFQKWDGGSQWHLGNADGSPPTFNPNDAQSKELAGLNSLQAAVDNNTRTMQRISWDLFSIWWKFVSGAIPDDGPNGINVKTTLASVKSQAARWTQLNLNNNDLRAKIKTMSANLSAKQGTDTAFSQRKDPTLLVGGVQAGWPHDYLDKLQIRIDTQIVQLKEIISDLPTWGPAYDAFTTRVAAKLPAGLQAAAKNLMLEFSLLYKAVSISTSDCVLPLYHDQLETPGVWRDRWTGQPWFPLFIEWQAEYYHIPYDNFSLEPRDSDHSADVIRWGIRDYVDVSTLPRDLRTLSGRCLVLPQPTFSIANAVGQLLTNMGSNIPLKQPEIDFLNDKNNYYKLPFLSSTMTGLTPHLTTRISGAHIKPTQRPRGETVSASQAALEAAREIGMDRNILGTIVGQNTGLTPYGDSVQLDQGDNSGLEPAPFKPATHGQLRFTQINIIDKFGRAICVLDPSPLKAGRKHVPPCLSDIYTCQVLDKPQGSAKTSLPPSSQSVGKEAIPDLRIPNTITHDLPAPECEYAQIPPSINQPARINLTFCKPDKDSPIQWTPMNDWENPAYGWVVMNYADYGMQFFTSDGTFYRELRFGGPVGFVPSPPWTPYARPKATDQPTQLDLVINALTQSGNAGYLQAFYNMITLAFGEMQPPDSSYAQYVNSITGRPLALVNIGMSLELAAYPLVNESNVSGTQQYTLLGSEDPAASQSVAAAGAPSALKLKPPKQYSFPVQVGDRQRSYDGLVGFWKPPPPAPAPKSSSKSSPPPPLEASFDYNNLYTFWADTATSANVQSIKPDILSLSPFLVSPDKLQPDGTTYKLVDPDTQTLRRHSKLRPISALIDPFRDIHAFSATVPTVSVRLPRWATESALNKMTAFFHMGPVLLTSSVPGYNSDYQLTPESDIKTAPIAGKIGMPALNTSLWRWLQPYTPVPAAPPVSGGAAGLAAGDGNPQDAPPPPNYMPLGLLNVDQRPRFEAPPYVAVEGFLQLSQPLMGAQDVPKPGLGPKVST